MLTQILVIARKEILDGTRDVRSVISSLLYALMGPFVVMLVSLSVHPSRNGAGNESKVLIAMASVFTLVAAFAGGMNIAMDVIAGERERRSLLPLLLNPVQRIDVVAGKWLAVSLFSLTGLALNLMGFLAVFANAGVSLGSGYFVRSLALVLGIVPLALFAASLQLLISTTCRNVKEAQTYLSMAVFLPMGLGMFLVFYPGPLPHLFALLPVGGQQLQLESLLAGGVVSASSAAALGCFTFAFAIAMLRTAAARLERDAIIYGN